jgi:hypothetical protein
VAGRAADSYHGAVIRIADLRPLLAARWLCLLDAAVALVLVFVSRNWLDAAPRRCARSRT